MLYKVELMRSKILTRNLNFYAKQTLYSLFSRRDESNDRQIYFKKKFSFFGERGDPYAQKRKKLIPTNFYKFGYHSIRLDEIITNIKFVLLKIVKI